MQRLFDTYIALMRVIGGLRSAPGYDGQTLLLRAKDTLEKTDPSNGWSDLIPSLRVVDIPGNHLTVILPHNLGVGMPEIVSAVRRCAREFAGANMDTSSDTTAWSRTDATPAHVRIAVPGTE